MTQRQAKAAAAAAAVHRACYNQLATTLQRYRAQHQQATPCACDTSALYCVELLWKAPEIRYPSRLLVPGISSASFGTKQQQKCKEHAKTSTPVAPSSSRQRHARVADTRYMSVELLRRT